MTEPLEGVGVTIGWYSCVCHLYELAFEARNGDRSHYVAGSSWTHWPVWIRLAPAPDLTEGGKMGGVGEVMNSTPFQLQGCMVVVCLSLVLGRSLPNRRCGCGKARRPKLRSGCV